MSARALKPPAKAYSPLERAVLVYTSTPSDENARAVAGELARADVDTKAAALDALARNWLLGPHDIAEAAALAVSRRKAS